jgi:putative ABC transport system permease protein
LVTGFGVQVRKDADPAGVRREIEVKVSGPLGLAVTSNRELKEQMLSAIDEGFSLLGAIEAAALLAGILGVINTLLVGMMERKSEIGMLRALGMKKREVIRMVMLETALQGLIASVLASAFGIGIAREWITGSLTRNFGWLVRFQVGWGPLAAAAAAGLLASALGAWWPARGAAGLEIVEALSHE